MLNYQFKFWIHLGVILGVPKWSKNLSKSRSQNHSQNRSQNKTKKHTCFITIFKILPLSARSNFLSPPLPDLPPRFLYFSMKRSAALRKLRQRFPSSADLPGSAYWSALAFSHISYCVGGRGPGGGGQRGPQPDLSKLCFKLFAILNLRYLLYLLYFPYLLYLLYYT